MATKVYTINLGRVDFKFCDDGFDFVVTQRPYFKNWDQFKYYWPLYLRDGIVNKIYQFTDELPDHYKSRPFYQGLKFDYVAPIMQTIITGGLNNG